MLPQNAAHLTILQRRNESDQRRVQNATVVIEAHDVTVQHPGELLAHNAQILQVEARGIGDNVGQETAAHLGLFGGGARPEFGRAQRRQFDVGYDEAGIRFGGQRCGQFLGME